VDFAKVLVFCSALACLVLGCQPDITKKEVSDALKQRDEVLMLILEDIKKLKKKK